MASPPTQEEAMAGHGTFQEVFGPSDIMEALENQLVLTAQAETLQKENPEIIINDEVSAIIETFWMIC